MRADSKLFDAHEVVFTALYSIKFKDMYETQNSSNIITEHFLIKLFHWREFLYHI